MSTYWQWSLRVVEESVPEWEALFWEEVPGQWSVHTGQGRTQHTVEVVFADTEDAEHWKRTHGGKLEELAPESDWSTPPEPAPPIKIRNRLLVTSVQTVEEIEELGRLHPDRTFLFIPPELAFGTGQHATTRTCLRLLVDLANEHDQAGRTWNLLDLGTGSGILAIAALQVGAESAVGVEFDERALRYAAENVTRNHLDLASAEGRLQLIAADVLEWVPERDASGERTRWELIAANLFHDVLIPLFPRLPELLAPGGRILVSGILRAQEAPVVAAGEAAGFEVEDAVRIGKWVTLQLKTAD